MRRKVLVMAVLLLATSVAAWESRPAEAASTRDDGQGEAAIMEQWRERAERVQERRKARISHEDRQAAAERGNKPPRSKGKYGSPASGKGGGKSGKEGGK